MARYRIITLVDITKSNPSRTDTDRIKQGQQSNYNTLLQTVTLRANIESSIDPKYLNGALPTNIGGKAKHWIWEFETDREAVFQKGNDPIGLLIEDMQGVPIIPDLTNIAVIEPPVFQTSGNNQNIWINLI